jgi:hypothetical protein
MLCFYLWGTAASQKQHELILGVLHGQERHSTPAQHMAGEEAHVEQEAPKEEGGLSEDDGEEEEDGAL